ncbi:hypothetical protein L598_000100000990 [Mesorhizobium sp. J18]|uniref:hypothetical protein n=1 Tax=Mesorhizobium sp. J18 TaxID=935263 RepID=UPI001199C811|nr:hypothetical protein [Mesorhizobium sp. J18]TWH01118.1 hypothetical protein L598_000100000990 [Mesorhizobium sp. J18]
MFIDYLWLFAVAAGPLILGIALGFALARRRYLSPGEQAMRDRATRELYEEKR